MDDSGEFILSTWFVYLERELGATFLLARLARSRALVVQGACRLGVDNQKGTRKQKPASVDGRLRCEVNAKVFRHRDSHAK
ncbi:hypothetical protein RRSWK_05106 [Rhodopirellula sp. SWK7]|nr:hypothetical protein RRSWK_05106 [Rhodopirellula sp. SWK7]